MLNVFHVTYTDIKIVNQELPTNISMSRFDPSTEPEFHSLYSQIFPDIRDPNGTFQNRAQWYGLKNDTNHLIAFCTVGQVNINTIFLYNIGVDPSYQHQGYGFQLLNTVFQMYHDCDAYLFVAKNNVVAIRLYRKCLFRRVDHEYVPPAGQICLKRYKNIIDT
jgi:ribosomal protein S18 acetylase RimI-like enzyme